MSADATNEKAESGSTDCSSVETLCRWVDPAAREAAKELVEDCPGEVLTMIAALINLDITTRDYAADLEADGFVFRTEEAISRADKYRETMNAICQVWND